MSDETPFEEEDVSCKPKGPPPISRVVDRLSDASDVLVVDASNLAWRSAYAYATLQTSQGTPSGHVFGALKLCLSTLQNHLPVGRWLMCFCYDGLESKADRIKILPTYKGDRDVTRFNPCDQVSAALKTLPGIHIEHRRREGDDAMAWAAEYMKSPSRGVTVLSGDKDLWALLRFPEVKVFSPNLDRYVTTEDVKTKLHTSYPAMVPMTKALFGDPSDGIKGVHRLLKAHVAPFIDVDKTPDVVNFIKEIEASTTIPIKTKVKILEDRSRIETNLSVILPNTAGFDRDTVGSVRFSEAQKEAVLGVMKQFECNSLVPAIGCFFGQEFLTRFENDN
jgi:5'-3' exonuclease